MRKAIILMITCSMIMGSVLTGCGDSSGNSVKDPGTKSTTSDEKKGPVTLTFTYWEKSPEIDNVIENACKSFTAANPNIKVETVHVPEKDYNAKMAEMDAANTLPDCGFMMGNLSDAWQRLGYFANLFDLLSKDNEAKKEDFLDFIWFKSSPDTAYAMTCGAQCFGLYYNKDMFNAANVEEPPKKAENAWSWDEFVEAAKKLTIDKNGKNAAQPGFDPKNIKQYGVSFESWWAPIQVHVLGNGGDLVAKDNSFGYSKPEAVDALQKLADLINVHHVALPFDKSVSLEPSGEKSDMTVAMAQRGKWARQATALHSKTAAMTMFGQWIGPDLVAEKTNFDVGVLPKMNKSITLGTSNVMSTYASCSLVVLKQSKNPDASWKFLKWITNPDTALELYSSGMQMPIYKKWYSDPVLLAKWAENNPAHPAGFKDSMAAQLINNGISGGSYYIKNFYRISDLTSNALEPVWQGKKSAADAMKELEVTMKTKIEGRSD